MNSGAANIAIGVARDGLRGMVIADSRNGFYQGVLIGQRNNAIGHLVGFVSSGFSEPRFKGGAFYYSDSNHFGAKFGYRAITFGNVISGEETYRNALTLKYSKH